MRLMSLNAWGGNIFEPLKNLIDRVRPDILLLQEVTSAVDASPRRLFFKGHGFDLPQQADLFADMAKVLDGHFALFCPAMQGELFDEAGRAYRSRFGLASFVHRDIAILEQVQAFAHGAYRPDGWGEPPVPRNMHVLRLFDPETQQAFVVAQLHGLRDPAGKHDTPDRMAQAEKIVGLISAVRQKGDPVVFCGDLNLQPDSRTFEILAAAGLIDLVTTRGFADTRTALYEKPERFADYLLVSPTVKVIDFDVPAEPVVSDHRPMMLEFEV
ncbi:MAG: endonuclease/exonuclease/phosphatase family protein [Alphaproteobacteria bacterium]|nr:endonuclease/exonuclease/phosphatase family protein [Alphaproteobacteria bacterium]